MFNRYEQIINELNTLKEILNNNPRDTKVFMNAETKFTNLLFDKVPPQDYALIAKGLGRKLTKKDVAKIVLAQKQNQSLAQIFNLPSTILMTLKLREYQRYSGLTQSKFARKYHIPQSKLSKMETGRQQVDADVLQKIVRSYNQKFVIE